MPMTMQQRIQDLDIAYQAAMKEALLQTFQLQAADELDYTSNHALVLAAAAHVIVAEKSADNWPNSVRTSTAVQEIQQAHNMVDEEAERREIVLHHVTGSTDTDADMASHSIIESFKAIALVSRADQEADPDWKLTYLLAVRETSEQIRQSVNAWRSRQGKPTSDQVVSLPGPEGDEQMNQMLLEHMNPKAAQAVLAGAKATYETAPQRRRLMDVVLTPSLPSQWDQTRKPLATAITVFREGNNEVSVAMRINAPRELSENDMMVLTYELGQEIVCQSSHDPHPPQVLNATIRMHAERIRQWGQFQANNQRLFQQLAEREAQRVLAQTTDRPEPTAWE